MWKMSLFALTLAILSLGAAAQNASSTPVDERAQWFVLRNHELGNCWTAVLVRINGQYTNSFEQRAGGPYTTEAQARERQKYLETQAACRP